MIIWFDVEYRPLIILFSLFLVRRPAANTAQHAEIPTNNMIVHVGDFVTPTLWSRLAGKLNSYAHREGKKTLNDTLANIMSLLWAR